MQSTKYIPVRKCAGCRSVKPRSELIRIAEKDGSPVLDAGGTMPGRGCYVCRDPECIRSATEKGGISRSFRKGFPRESVNALKEELLKTIF